MLEDAEARSERGCLDEGGSGGESGPLSGAPIGNEEAGHFLYLFVHMLAFAFFSRLPCFALGPTTNRGFSCFDLI